MPRPHVPQQLTVAPFDRTAALAVGVTPSALRSAPWRPIFRGVWAHDSLPDTREHRLEAARLIVPPRGVLCGLTAAWLYGADVRREDDLDVHVSFPEGQRIRGRAGLVVSQEKLHRDDVWSLAGLSVTSPVRTVFDCMRLLRGAQRLVVADAMTHLGRTSLEELRRYFASQRRLRNLRVAERLLDDVEPLSESPMETRLRVLFVDGGLPRPVAQHEVRTAAGAFVGRVDLAYVSERIAIEYDGAWHWKQRRDDDRRRAAIRACNWDVHVFSSDDVYGAPDAVVSEIRGALRTRRAS